MEHIIVSRFFRVQLGWYWLVLNLNSWRSWNKENTVRDAELAVWSYWDARTSRTMYLHSWFRLNRWVAWSYIFRIQVEFTPFLWCWNVCWNRLWLLCSALYMAVLKSCIILSAYHWLVRFSQTIYTETETRKSSMLDMSNLISACIS